MSDLSKRVTGRSSVEPHQGGQRLSIPAGPANHYRLAQLDDCSALPRRSFLHRSLDFRLRARVSAQGLPGTWGFGAWNDPYRISPGIDRSPFQVLTLPRAAWFFYSSQHSYLSFRDDKPGNGFLAQAFSSPTSLPVIPLAGVAGTFLFSRVSARRKLSRLIEEEAVSLSLDATQWHSYRILWQPGGVRFEVDEQLVLETAFSPAPPLGIVIWIDNQYAAFTPQGKVAFGALPNPQAWLEIDGLSITQ